jgi:hypothetical protein
MRAPARVEAKEAKKANSMAVGPLVRERPYPATLTVAGDAGLALASESLKVLLVFWGGSCE